MLSTGKFAVDLIGRSSDLRLKSGLDPGEHLFRVALFRLLEGSCDVASEVGKHHPPGFGFLPDAHPQADVLILVRDPDAQQFEGFSVGRAGSGTRS